MDNIILGEINVVNPREVWCNEEKKFTPWLANNIGLISKVIGIPIIVEQTEKELETMSLIYGRVDGTDEVVIIENQLEQSDHKHLGQVITYAAGLEASIIIWITPQVTDEHKTAVNWLNNISGDKTNFFLLKPEVIRIDESKPAVRFQLEASPSDFVKSFRTVTAKEDTPRHAFRRWFWSELFKYLASNGQSWAEGRRTTKDSWISSPLGKTGINANISMAQGSRIRVEIYLCHSDQNKNTEWYKLLLENKDYINKLFVREEVMYESLDNAKSSRIAVYSPYEKERVETEIEYRYNLFLWINNNIKIMREVANKFLGIRE